MAGSAGAAAAAVAMPSAEEFLTQLSTEVLRATHSRRERSEYAGVDAGDDTRGSSSSSSSSSSSPPSFLHNLVESTLPAAASAMGVAAAAESYNPASYARVASQMASLSSGSDVNDALEERGVDYATAFAATSNSAQYADYADHATAGYAEPLSSVESAASAASNAATTITDTGGEGLGGASSQSFAAWHSQGGSNSLRDLATSIPVVDPIQQDVSYAASSATASAAQDGFAGMNQYYATDYASAQDMSGVHDYSFGSGDFYLVDNSVDVGVQQVAPVIQDAVSNGGVDGAVAASASDVLSADSVTSALDGAPVVQDAASNGGVDGAVAASASDVLSVDTDTMTSVLDGVADPGSVPEVGDGLADSLSSQLSELNYDGLHGSVDGQAAVDALQSPPKSPMLSDYIKTKLEHIDVPKASELPKVSNPFAELHVSPPKLDKIDLPKVSNPFSEFDLSPPKLDKIDLPKVSNPFSEFDLSPPKLDKIDLPKVSNPFSEFDLSTQKFPSVEESLSSAKEAKEELGAAFNTASHSLEAFGVRAVDFSNSFSGSFKPKSVPVGKAVDAGMSGAKALENAVPSGASKVAELPPPSLPKLNFEAPALPNVKLPQPHLPEANLQAPSLPKMDIHPPSIPSNVVDGLALKHVGDASLSDFGNGIVSSIQFIGGILVKFLDLILGAVAGTSVASLLNDVQTSVSSVINGASHAVMSTIDNVANMSVKEILQHLVALIIAITDILLKIANAVVYILSGRDGGDWALQASTSVHDASSQLMATAAHTYDDVTHESISQLTHAIGDYSQHVGSEFLAMVGNLNGEAVDGISSMLDADTLDSVATAVQTALTL